jgi:hypothetical protein
MKKFLTVTVAALVIAGLSSGVASAKHKRHHARPVQQTYPDQGGWNGGWVPLYGNAALTGDIYGNAALMGNNGNSANGDNSLGHIKGGNIGGGK